MVCSKQLCKLFVVTSADLYYVTVIGSLGNSRPAKVAAPWTPNVKNTDCTDLCSPFKHNSSYTSLHDSPRKSPVAVKAYAGPMTSSQVGNGSSARSVYAV